MSKSSVAKKKSQRNFFRKFLPKQLHKAEVEVLLAVLDCELHAKAYYAGRLGIAENLVERGWLRRDPATGAVTLSTETRSLLAECGE